MKNISIKDLKNKKEKKKQRSYYDRYNDAIEFGFNNSEDYFEKINKSFVFHFKNIIILSNNDMLRIHYKKSYKYRELWKERVISLIEKANIKKLKTPILVEALYIKNKNKALDYDSSVSCLKYILDGLVKSGIINDDNLKHIPHIMTKTIINNNEKYDSIIISIKEIDENYNPYSKEFNQIIESV